jgi:hypothetical protein
MIYDYLFNIIYLNLLTLLLKHFKGKQAQTPSTSGCDIVWYLDTGASNHMTGHKHLFAKMTELVSTVSFGDASKVEVKEKCNVMFLQKNGKLGMIEDVYYISEIKEKHSKCGPVNEKGVQNLHEEENSTFKR